MSTESFIGEIKILTFDWAPKGYMLCSGQILSISTNTALFSLLGTTYGGNGQDTFGLPDLRGRTAIGQGTGPGLPQYTIGEKAGSASVTILNSNMPAHAHSAQGIIVNSPVSVGGGDTDLPTDNYLAKTTGDFYSTVATPNNNYGQMAVSGQTSVTGDGLPVTVMNPYLVINYSIAISGIFPSRN
jgi:microcystin-dependent protein